MPESVPSRYRGKVITDRVRRFPERVVALTFDDGPSEDVTPNVLKALADHHAHATFFVLGQYARLHPELLKQEKAAGHAIGNHSYDHPASTSPAQAESELRRTAAIIKQATGRAPVLFRPPYGITRGTLGKLAVKEGYTVVTWTISSADTRPIGPEMIANNVIHTPNPGDIVLMHDGPGRGATGQAVPLILDQLSAAGWRFVTLPELLSAWDRWQRRRTPRWAIRRGSALRWRGRSGCASRRGRPGRAYSPV